jgi:hypothetical protein
MLEVLPPILYMMSPNIFLQHPETTAKGGGVQNDGAAE